MCVALACAQRVDKAHLDGQHLRDLKSSELSKTPLLVIRAICTASLIWMSDYIERGIIATYYELYRTLQALPANLDL